MTDDLLARLDPGISPEVSDATFLAFRDLADAAPPDRADAAYGPDPRQRLDLYLPAAAGAAPLLLFVPGGGFTGGDKARYGGLARAATARGAVVAVMTYRLAPAAPYPAGAEDVSAAARWLEGQAERLGAAPDRLLLVGHSAGASHVADCLALPALRPTALAATGLLCGVYEPDAAPVSPGRAAYYAEGAPAALPVVAALDRPLFVARAERDPEVFRIQAARLAEAAGVAIHEAAGHTHISAVAAAGTPYDRLTGPLFRALGI